MSKSSSTLQLNETDLTSQEQAIQKTPEESNEDTQVSLPQNKEIVASEKPSNRKKRQARSARARKVSPAEALPSSKLKEPSKAPEKNTPPPENSLSNAMLNEASLEGRCIKNRYILESKLGTGGMSDVYKAKDLLLEKTGIENSYVAVKVLKPQLSNQVEALQLLFKEAHKTKQLSHPNIIRLFDIDTDGELYYLVMEYMDGETLDQIIKRSKPRGLKLKGTINLLSQIAKALDYAHSKGIIHADLKPANIMLTRDGQIKVFDFGVAHDFNPDHDSYSASSNLAQSAGGYTPTYASPELLSGNPPCIKDDIFSFGCVAYELLTSRHPFNRLPANQASEKGKTIKKPSHLSLLKWKHLQNALDFNQSKRPGSAKQLTSSFQRSYLPALGIVSISTIIIGAFISYGYMQKNEIDQLKSIFSNSDQQKASVTKLLNMSDEAFLNDIKKEDSLKKIESEGLLRIHRMGVLDYVDAKVNTLLNDREHSYPNYPVIQRLLSETESIYPDSARIINQKVLINRGKQTALDALNEQLHNLLLESKYESTGQAETIPSLVSALKYIENDYKVKASNKEFSLYKSAFKSAIAKNNIPRQASLIDIGEIVFGNMEQAQQLLDEAKQRKGAVAELDRYQKAIKNGSAIPFPYGAAIHVYQDSFSSLIKQLSDTRSVYTVDKIYKKSEDIAINLPKDFAPLVEIRKKIASKYLSMIDKLIKGHNVRTAERAMLRANKLMSNSGN